MVEFDSFARFPLKCAMEIWYLQHKICPFRYNRELKTYIMFTCLAEPEVWNSVVSKCSVTLNSSNEIFVAEK